jgi:hypothetical protein
MVEDAKNEVASSDADQAERPSKEAAAVTAEHSKDESTVADVEHPKRTSSQGNNRARYSSVVYFHGMGDQRRYEETSRLIDSLDRYLVNQNAGGNDLGRLRNIKVRVEPLRSDRSSKDIVGFIRTAYSGGNGQGAGSVRFYEAYWAPVMAENKSAWGVVKWLFKQPLRPWRTLRSPWRERQRLRRASLVALFEKNRATPSAHIEEGDYTQLMRLYDEFEGLDAQRRFLDGTFEEFIEFVKDESKADPAAAARRVALAQAWHADYTRSELRNAAALAIMTLALVMLAAGTLLGILIVLKAALGSEALAGLLKTFGASIEADWKTVSATAAALVGFLGISRFLTNYLGDVESWATYQETDSKHTARNKVLDQSIQLLTHVLEDGDCDRVTVVAHSLGTSVAHDALLALTRRNRASNAQDPIAGPVPLYKIEHFVTMGSPIDKIEYFFESYSSPSHRYKRVVEALRGDIGVPPFTRNRHPHIHWINFWDQGDAISGALHSPASAIEFCQRVDNVHVASYGFPAPGASHAGYFTHRTVIDTLFQVIYRRAFSFRTLQQPNPGRPYDYESVHLGLKASEPLGTRSGYIFMAAATPLLVLIALMAWLLEARLVAYTAGGLSGAVMTFLFLAYLASSAKGQRKPI